jgi:hypothetical protein
MNKNNKNYLQFAVEKESGKRQPVKAQFTATIRLLTSTLSLSLGIDFEILTLYITLIMTGTQRTKKTKIFDNRPFKKPTIIETLEKTKYFVRET